MVGRAGDVSVAEREIAAAGLATMMVNRNAY